MKTHTLAIEQHEHGDPLGLWRYDFYVDDHCELRNRMTWLRSGIEDFTPKVVSATLLNADRMGWLR